MMIVDHQEIQQQILQRIQMWKHERDIMLYSEKRKDELNINKGYNQINQWVLVLSWLYEITFQVAVKQQGQKI